MYDINFFSVLKKHRQKNKNVKIIFIGFLVFLIVANAILLTFGYLAKRKVQTHISQNQAYLNSSTTKAKVRDAAILDKELSIAKSYLDTIKIAADAINKTNLIKLDLIDHIRSITPATTFYESVTYKENTIELNCISNNQTDPMLFYNRLLSDSRFSHVFMPGINIKPETGQVSFEIRLTIKGGVES